MERQGTQDAELTHKHGSSSTKHEGGAAAGAVLGPELALHTRAWSLRQEVGGRLVPVSMSLHNTLPYKTHGVQRRFSQPHDTVIAANTGPTVCVPSFVEDTVPIFKKYLRN